MMSDCRIYELPNQTREHIEYAEAEFEERGADLDESEVVFIGGTLYAHDYKARHPEADVTAVEVDPIAAYTQRFAGHQLEEGEEPEQIVEYLFNFDTEKHEGKNTIVSQDEYEQIREVHKNFVGDENLFDENFLEEVFFMEPDYGAEQIVYPKIEDDNPKPAERGKSWFFHYEGSVVGKWLKEFKDNHISSYRDDVERTIDVAQEQIHDEHALDTGELREVAPEPREDIHGDPLDSLINGIQKWKEKSHRRHAEDKETYIHATETEDGRIKISKSARSSSLTHERLLKNIEQVERPDEIVIGDARDMSMSADIIFSNNVFRYFNSSEEVRDTVDDIADEEGAVLESTPNIHGDFPGRVEHIESDHSGHHSSSINYSALRE
jgi:hypothetical protein